MVELHRDHGMGLCVHCYNYLKRKKFKTLMQKEGFGVNVLIVGHRCYRCEHAWVPRNISEIPEICPKCKSPYWKKPKTRFTKNDKKELNSKNKKESKK